MDTCKEYREKDLLAYLKNKMSRRETEDFQFHLIHCKVCQDTLKRMRLMIEEESTPVVIRFERHKPYKWYAAAIGLLIVSSIGGYLFFNIPEGTDHHLDMDKMPVFHTTDSIGINSDSIRQKDSIQVWDSLKMNSSIHR